MATVIVSLPNDNLSTFCHRELVERQPVNLLTNYLICHGQKAFAVTNPLACRLSTNQNSSNDAKNASGMPISLVHIP
jgi:hypothetical protein